MTENIKVMILRTAGTNCDHESAHAFTLAGATPESVHVNRLIEKPAMLRDYQIMVIPGGFSYGDDIAAGKILANQLTHHFDNEVRAFIDADKLVLGICNGFQVLVKARILPGLKDPPGDSAAQRVTITDNDSGKFEDRWVHLQPGTDKCVFLDPNERIYLPIAHGEGKVCFINDDLSQHVAQQGQVALRYVDQQGQFGDYPINPNGSTDHIAGLCDPTGRVLGLMPHPERFVHPTQHPCWTRRKIEQPDGLKIFTRAVQYFK